MHELEPLNVLIVEDEAVLALDLQGTIEDAGHNVVGWAMNAGEARRMVVEGGIDVAFVDIQLGDGPSGIEVAEFIRGTSDSTVIFLTANPTRIPEHFAGAVGVIAKPYTVAGLAQALKYLQEGVRSPPPAVEPPPLLRLAPQFETVRA